MYRLMALHASLQARLAAREEGQGMLEYALIIAAVALAVIVAVFALGPKVASMFQQAGTSLSSDRNKKTHFAAVDSREVLGRVATLPIETWSYLSQGQEPVLRRLMVAGRTIDTAPGGVKTVAPRPASPQHWGAAGPIG